MSETDLIERMASAVAKHLVPPLPTSIDLWDTELIGRYLKRSTDDVRKRIVCLPSFPKPIRLPVPGRAQALYKAREVIKWAENQTS